MTAFHWIGIIIFFVWGWGIIFTGYCEERNFLKFIDYIVGIKMGIIIPAIMLYIALFK